MAVDPRTARPVTLGQNQYGKAENRVVRITRDGATHHIKDLNVSVALSGDLDDVHHSGSNAHVLPTDTVKNTVFVFAKEHGIASAEQFGIHLARHFVTSREPVHRARVRVEEYAWERVTASGTGPGSPDGAGTGHSFVRGGQEVRTAQITYDGGTWEVVSGLRDLTVLNSTHSEFRGFARDGYTTLQEAHDRVLATSVSGRWRFSWSHDTQEAPDWESSYEQVRTHLLRAFAETYSLSLQQTLYQMGARIIEHRAEIDEVRFSLPNSHHILVDLEPFGLGNDNEVYFATDRPYGLIEGTVLRAGCEARIPADLTTL
ncbi:factor-independent urate hydroxylase [Streptomyces sp. SID8352]|uniref:factor-independent urate hydroxylase n=1 Tax=Streptomyces sp. SID8352 TaxID=2690338 RepID=UPI0013713722|nr:urate oxidase [Streptomyces sp. SID8352]MYU26041.1 urate oxidase [Streptomyces sp. SID8352]